MTPSLLDNTNLAIRDFAGDFDQIATLMDTSWSENHSQQLLYTADFLKSCFEYPGASFALAPTLYSENRPVAFVAGFPRTFCYRGKQRRILLITFVTVAPELKKRGYGNFLWTELVNRARSSGFSGMLHYCVEGEALDRMIQSWCDRLHLPTERIYSIPYLTTILWPKPTADMPPLQISKAAETLTLLASELPPSVSFGRVWSPGEAAWQCSRAGAVVASFQEGPERGLMTGYVMELADPTRTRVLLIEDILWGSLKKEQKIELIKRITQMAAARGARIANTPNLGYADMEPFGAARFRPSRRVLNTYLTLWEDEEGPEPLSEIYADVL